MMANKASNGISTKTSARAEVISCCLSSHIGPSVDVYESTNYHCDPTPTRLYPQIQSLKYLPDAAGSIMQVMNTLPRPKHSQHLYTADILNLITQLKQINEERGGGLVTNLELHGLFNGA